MQKKKVFVAVPTIGTLADATFYALRALEKNYADKVEMVYPKHCIRRIFHDYARNELVEEFMETDCDILLFLDSDVGPPTDLFDMLEEDWDVAGAPYPIFMTPSGEKDPQIVFTAYKGTSNKGYGIADIPREGKEFIDGLATGCMFIKRHVIEKLSKPYFEFKFNEESRQMTVGEDLGFCRKVNALGYKFFVDYSMVCKHYKTVCLLDMNNYAIEYANRSVRNYDANIVRPKLEVLQSYMKEKKASQEAAKKPEAKSSLILPDRFRT